MVNDSDASSQPGGLHARHFSHLFVHGSYAHLFNNLAACMQCAFAVYKDLGSLDMYLVFFGGGAAASLPSILRLEQNKRLAESIVRRAVPIEAISYLPDWMARPARAGSEKLVGVMQQILVKTSSCGSSGAVMSLMGCGLGLLLSDVISAAASKWIEVGAYEAQMRRQLERAAADMSALNVAALARWRGNWFDRIKKRLWSSLGAVAASPNLLLRTVNALNVVRLLLVDASFLGSLASDEMLVDRAAHLQGAAFGLAYALLRNALSPRGPSRRLL